MLSQKSIQLAGFAFVDDTNLCVTIQPDEQITIHKNAKGSDSQQNYSSYDQMGPTIQNCNILTNTGCGFKSPTCPRSAWAMADRSHKCYGKEWKNNNRATNGQEHRNPHKQSGKPGNGHYQWVAFQLNICRVLQQPLGPWWGTNEPNWGWYINNNIPRLYNWDRNSWTFYIQIPCRTCRLQFTNQPMPCTQTTTPTKWKEWDIATIQRTKLVITVMGTAQQVQGTETATGWDEQLLTSDYAKQWQLEISEELDTEIIKDALKTIRP